LPVAMILSHDCLRLGGRSLGAATSTLTGRAGILRCFRATAVGCRIIDVASLLTTATFLRGIDCA